MTLRISGLLLIATMLLSAPLWAQDEPTTPPEETSEKTTVDKAKEVGESIKESTKEAAGVVKEKTEEVTEYALDKSEEITKQLDESEEAKKYSAGILEPIYALAEYMSFSSFHWAAFALMVSGVVSFAFQLVLAKLAVLMRGGLSLTEILADAQGLLISLVGLFLTTQAATENSDFTTSPASVLSAAVLGAIVGFMFYWWGQSQEIQALKGRKVETRKD